MGHNVLILQRLVLPLGWQVHQDLRGEQEGVSTVPRAPQPLPKEWDGECPPPSHTSVATPQPLQPGKVAAALQTSRPFPEGQSAKFASLFCIFLVHLHHVYADGVHLPPGRAATSVVLTLHPPTCCPASPTAAQPQSPSNLQHGIDEPPACSKAANPILPQRYRKRPACCTKPQPGRMLRRTQAALPSPHPSEETLGLVTG